MASEDSRSRQRTAEEREAARHERAERRKRREAAAGGSGDDDAVAKTSGDAGAVTKASGDASAERGDASAETAAGGRASAAAAGELAAPDSDEQPTAHAEQVGTTSTDEPAARLWDGQEVTPADQAEARQPASAPTPEELTTPPREPRGSMPLRESQLGGAAGGARRHSVRARVAVGVALVLVAALIWLIVSIFQPFAGSGKGRVVVTIPKGASAGQIAGILARRGVVESSLFFEVRTFLDGSRGDLRAGTFTLKREMSYAAAIAALSKATAARPKVVKVVIPEGETRVQIAETAKKDGLRGSYMKASTHAPNFPPTHYGAPASTPNLEGFLFPATYELDVGASVKELVTEQLVAFTERFGESATARAKAMKLTPYQLLIVASMIEREAELPHDRPLVAAVIYNRLRLGIPLGIDATIRFALGDYDKPLTESQLKTPSPYNTRLHKGLPPTPISNPGVEAIEAAAHPAKAGYLYYVAGADGCGDLVFANTYAEFERDSAAYHEALAANGGRVPSCKHK